MKYFILLFPFLNFAYGKIHNDFIEKVCNKMKYNNCELVRAIIENESSYNPNSIGKNKIDLGLMQVQCATAQMLDQRKKRLLVECKKLYDPEINIKYGIEYLVYLDNFLAQKPSVEDLLSVYNGGYTPNREPRICNTHSLRKKRKCKPGEPFNVEYLRKVLNTYYKIRKDKMTTIKAIKAKNSKPPKVLCHACKGKGYYNMKVSSHLIKNIKTISTFVILENECNYCSKGKKYIL